MRILFLLVAFTATCTGFSQAVYATMRQFRTSKGMVQIRKFADHIYQVSFQLTGDKTPEQTSDAVIMRTPQTSTQGFDASLRNDSLFIEGKLVLCGFKDSAGYKGMLFPLRAGEAIFGGGERALPLNRRGQRLGLYNNPAYGYGVGAENLNYSVPFVSSSAGYGLLFNNPSRSFLDIGKSSTNVLEYGAVSGAMEVFILFGDFREVLQSYHKLTGTQPMPPRWALGNLMSRFGYSSDAQVRAIYDSMKAKHIPVDAIIFDLFWFGDSIKGTLGNLDWINKKAWPDPVKMIADFKKDGVKTILVTEPYFVETARNYTEAKPYLAVDSNNRPFYLTQFYFGKGGLLDIFRKDARDWFWPFYRAQMKKGVEAWWGDLGEPENHPDGIYHNLRDLGYNRLFKGEEVHNIYGHYWTKMLFENFAKEYPDKRLFSLNRSGFIGSQRYSIFPWTGDVGRNWSGLNAQLPVLLGMSMSGIPYVHSDAGGFAGGEGDNELYVRWLQFAAFTPIFRPHGTALYEIDPGAASFPSEAALIAEPYRAIAIQAVRQRYQYLPYNYTLSYEQATNGKPLMAPLYYYFPADTSLFSIQDEFLWGDAVLVAPVLEKGAKTRRYYLPQGKWYHTGKDSVLEGGNWYQDNVSLGSFPVLYREGSFVTRAAGKTDRNTSSYKGDSLWVSYVPSAMASSGFIYNDDGSGKKNIDQKKFEKILFRSAGVQSGRLKLEIRSDGGNYPGKPLKRFIRLDIAQPLSDLGAVKLNGKPIREAGVNRYSYEYPSLSLQLEFTGKPLVVEIEL